MSFCPVVATTTPVDNASTAAMNNWVIAIIAGAPTVAISIPFSALDRPPGSWRSAETTTWRRNRPAVITNATAAANIIG